MFLAIFLCSITLVASDCPASSAAPIALTISDVSIDSQNAFTYGIRLDVGDPKQNVCLTPSTVVDNTLLVSKNICTGDIQDMTQAQCLSYHGGTYDILRAGASFKNVSLDSANLPLDTGWTTFNPRYTVAGSTNVELVSNFAVPNITVVVLTDGNNFTAGHMGLGKQSTILRHLKDSNIIPSMGFGLNAGSQSIDDPRDGNLVLGGYDSASLLSSFYNYPMNYSDTIAQRHCPLQVRIQNLQLLLQERSPIELIGSGDSHSACIEPYDNRFRFSQIGLDRFKQYTDWSPTTTAGSSGLYISEPGLVYPSTTGFNGSLRFTLDQGMIIDIPNSELQHPLRGLNPSGKPVPQPNVTEVNIYSNPLDAWVLGKVFLSRVYLAVDYDAQQIQLAQVKQNAVTPNPAQFASATAGCNKKRKLHLAAGGIAATVIGIIFALFLILVIVYYFHRRKRPVTTILPSHDVIVSATPPRSTSYASGTVRTSSVGHPLERCEVSGERRAVELPSPNGGYPPPSPHAPIARPVPTREPDGSNMAPMALATTPWNT